MLFQICVVLDYRDNQIPLSSYMSLYKQTTSLYKQINNIDEKKEIIIEVNLYEIRILRP